MRSDRNKSVDSIALHAFADLSPETSGRIFEAGLCRCVAPARGGVQALRNGLVDLLRRETEGEGARNAAMRRNLNYSDLQLTETPGARLPLNKTPSSQSRWS